MENISVAVIEPSRERLINILALFKKIELAGDADKKKVAYLQASYQLGLLDIEFPGWQALKGVA